MMPNESLFLGNDYEQTLIMSGLNGHVFYLKRSIYVKKSWFEISHLIRDNQAGINL